MAQIKKQSEEVFYAEGEVIACSASDIDFLRRQAEQNPRKRARLCTHRDTGDRLHEMIIVNMRETYVRPHKNTDKPKSFLMLVGMMDVVVFDDAGGVVGATRLGPNDSGFPCYYRLHETRYHSLRILSGFAAFLETTTGPFRPGDTVFAPWAPEDSKPTECAAFVKQIDSAVAKVVFP